MSSLRSIIAGSKVRILASVLVSVLLLLAGGIASGAIGPPAVTDVENQFGTVTNETTEIGTNISIQNPNPIGLNLSETAVRYEMQANGVPLASGEKQGVHVRRGNSTVRITTLMKNERIPDWWVAHVRNGERTRMTVDATVDVGEIGQSFGVTQHRSTSTDILGEFGSTDPRPVRADETGVQDPILIIEETSAEWGSVSEARTPIEMDFVARNPQDLQPVTVTTVGYDITMNGIQVGSGEVERNRVLAPGQTKTIPLTTVIDNSMLDEWWVTHLQRNQITEFKIEFYVEVEIEGAGTFTVPMDALTYTDTIETDILGSKPAPDAYQDDSTATGGTPTTTAAGQTTTEPTVAPPGTLTAPEAPTSTDAPDDRTPTPSSDATDGPDDDTPTPTPAEDGLL